MIVFWFFILTIFGFFLGYYCRHFEVTQQIKAIERDFEKAFRTLYNKPTGPIEIISPDGKVMRRYE